MGIVELMVSGNTTGSTYGGIIQLNDFEPISLSKSVSDVKDISTNSTTFSKNFVVPSNANNDRIFDSLFLIGADGYYDPRKKARAWILVDTIPLEEGFIQLLSVNITNKQAAYELVFYADANDFLTKIEGLYLEDINLSAYNHTLSAQTIVNSWTASTNTLPYIYPLIDYGYNFDSVKLYTSGVTIEQFQPAIYDKVYWDAIWSGAGFTYTSQHLSSTAFTETLTPCNANIIPSQGRLERLFSTEASATPLGTISGAYINAGGNVYYTPFDIQSPPFVPTLLPTLGTYFNSTPDTFIADTYSYQNFNLNLKYSINPSITNLVNGYITLQLFRSTFAGGSVPYHSESTPAQPVGTYQYLFKSPFLSQSLSSNYYPVQAGESFTAVIKAVVQFAGSPIGTQTPISLSAATFYNDVAGTGTIYMNDYIPKKVKQIDFLKGIINKFNLWVIPDRTKRNHFIIEPRDQYLSSGVTKTWVLDNSKPIQEKLLSELQSKIIRFSDKDDKDYLNTRYKDLQNQTYGQYLHEVDNDFVKGQKEITTVFSPTPNDNINGDEEFIIPQIYKLDNNNYGKIDSNIRILYRKPVLQPLTSGQTWNIYGTTYTGLTSYPYCGHVNEPFLATGLDLNWGSVDFMFYRHPNNLTTQNCINTYWKSYLDMISDKNAKLITCYVKLSPIDIYNFNYNDKVFIDGITNEGGHFYLVNKIDYTVTNNDTAKVELIKFKDVPIRYIESVLESSPDLDASTLRSAISLGGGRSSSSNSISHWIGSSFSLR